MNAATTRAFSAFLPTRDTVRMLVAPVLLFIVAGVDRGYQTDFWQHLARGREIVKARRIISADPFTFTVPGKPMCDGNWLSQVLYFALHQLGGLALVQLVNALVLAAAMLILVRIARRLSGSTGIAALAGILALAGIRQTILIRPQSFSILFFMILFAVLLRIRQGASRRWLILPPVLLALWANVHGGFGVGLLLIGAFALTALVEQCSRRRSRTPSPLYSSRGFSFVGWALPTSSCEDGGQCPPYGGEPSPNLSAEERGQGTDAFRLLFCLTASIYATFLNPLGLRVYTYAVGLSSRGIQRGIEEWLPPSLHLWIGWAFFSSVLLLIAVFIFSKTRPKLLHVILIALFLPPAFMAVRVVAWWFLILPVILAEIVGNPLIAPKPAGLLKPTARPSSGAAICVTALLVAALFSVPFAQRLSPIFALRSAHRTEDDLAEISNLLNRAAPSGKSAGRIFCRMEWGNYLCWSAYPNYRVYMEGHVELYDDALWREYSRTNAASAQWDEGLEQRGVQLMILDDQYHVKLLASAIHSGNWASVMHRPGITVLARTHSEMADSIARVFGGSTDTNDQKPSLSDSVSAGIAHISPDGR